MGVNLFQPFQLLVTYSRPRLRGPQQAAYEDRPPEDTPGQNGFGTIGMHKPDIQNLGLCHRDKTCLSRVKKINNGNFSSYWPFLGVTGQTIYGFCFNVSQLILH